MWWRSTQDGYLEKEVEGHPGEDTVSEELNDTEEGEHHPVGEPLGVIVLVLRVNGLATAHNKKWTPSIYTSNALTHTQAQQKGKRKRERERDRAHTHTPSMATYDA